MGDAVERAALDGALADEGEPSLHLVEPEGGGRGEVEVEPRPLGQLGAYLGMVGGRVVVQNQMQVEIGRRLAFDEPQERKEILMPVALGAPADSHPKNLCCKQPNKLQRRNRCRHHLIQRQIYTFSAQRITHCYLTELRLPPPLKLIVQPNTSINSGLSEDPS